MTRFRDDNLQTSEDNAAKSSRRPSNLVVRLLTGLVLLPVIMVIYIYGRVPFALFIAALVGLGTLEFYFMEKRRGIQNNVVLGLLAAAATLVAFYIEEPRLWQGAWLLCGVLTFLIEYVRGRDLRDSLVRVLTTLGGLLYIALPGAFYIAIRQGAGIHWAFVVVFCTWSVDTYSYIFGNMLGKTPLAPRLSPNKTREGAVAGLIAGVIMPLLLLLRGEVYTHSAIPLLLLLPVVAILGDLFESSLKRFFDVKDSGVKGFNPFPGHGGVLDRVDSMLGVIVCVYSYLVLTGQVTLVV